MNMKQVSQNLSKKKTCFFNRLSGISSEPSCAWLTDRRNLTTELLCFNAKV